MNGGGHRRAQARSSRPRTTIRHHAMDSPLKVLFFVLPLLALIAAAEGWYLQRRRGRDYDWRAYFASLADAIGRRAVVIALGSGVAGAFLYWIWEHRLATIPMDSAWSWLGLFVGQEFCYYWMHRADHRIRWLWATHAVHHSPNQLNLSAAYRLGWTAPVSGAALFFAPLVYIGFSPLVVLVALATNLLYQFWLHTELIGRLGPLEWVLNTPAHHRVHHASNPEYLDRNYGGVLIVFDRLFGTLAVERADTPLVYGLVKPLTTHNPLKIAFHAWWAMFRDLAHARSVREVFLTLLGPPEWHPAASQQARRDDVCAARGAVPGKGECAAVVAARAARGG
uniref:Fatty acid hydroxylase n=1 Tax=bacterium enrichment culture TaxID=207831 RepID=A0A0R7N6K3_9BACT|nr:fatty acid hydroxylase [bacterium enrichment culture]